MRNLSIKLYHIYVCYMNITLYHIIYSIWYYLWFHITAVGLGTYYLRIRGLPVVWYLVYKDDAYSLYEG